MSADDVKVGIFYLAEAIGDVSAGELHPGILKPFHGRNFTVVELIHHRLGIVADTVERLGDLFVAFTDLHLRDLFPYDFVEHAWCG